MRSRVGFLCLGSGLALCLPSPVFAGTCALCRQALAAGGNPGLIRGFYWSILLIAGVPLAIMAVIGVLVWRRQRQRTPANSARHPSCAHSLPS